MDQAWVAVIGAAIGSAGATGAALVAGWSGHRQTSIEVSGQQQQWRRQMRRDAYGALLRAGAQARDELGSLLILLRDTDTTDEPDWLTDRLSETKSLVNAVRLATATVYVEGPPVILEPARRVEEGIVLFHTAMTAIAKELSGPKGGNTASFLAICSQQRVSVRADLIAFAAAARAAIDEEPPDPEAPAPARATDSTRELSWLITGIAEALGIPETRIDPDRTLWESELDSITILKLAAFFQREHAMTIKPRWFFELHEQPLRDVADLLATLRTTASSTDPQPRTRTEQPAARTIEPSTT